MSSESSKSKDYLSDKAEKKACKNKCKKCGCKDELGEHMRLTQPSSAGDVDEFFIYQIARPPNKFGFNYFKSSTVHAVGADGEAAISPGLSKAISLIEATRSVLARTKSKCPKSGCVVKRQGKWRIVSSKTGKLFPQVYSSRQHALDALAAYHIRKKG